jgi:RNA polymerase sigma factor (sigma-70 family)
MARRDSGIEAVIAGCRKNERQAQNLLFKYFEKKVLAVCMRYTSSFDEARDLQQETFIKVFRVLIQTSEVIDSIDSFIVRVAVNTAIDFLRKKKSLSLDAAAENQNAIMFPAALDSLNEEDLIRVIQCLPPACRTVFNLSVIEGYAHKEIGKMLHITESASRAYLTRAKQLLRVKISEQTSNVKLKDYGHPR